MSAAPGLAPGRPRPAVRTPAGRRPALSVVPAQRPAAALGRTPFVVLVVGLLAAGLLGLLALNTALAQDAFALHTLKEDSRALEDREQVLQREVEALRAPQALASRATELGMVPAGPPAFLRLEDGAVLGATEPAPVPGAAGEAGAEAGAEAAPAAEAGTEIGGQTEPSSASAPPSAAPAVPDAAETEEGR